MIRKLQAGDKNAAHLVFCIGGPFGHSAELRTRADRIVKLSDMVLNHQVHLNLVCISSTVKHAQVLTQLLASRRIMSRYGLDIRASKAHDTADCTCCAARANI